MKKSMSQGERYITTVIGFTFRFLGEMRQAILRNIQTNGRLIYICIADPTQARILSE